MAQGTKKVGSTGRFGPRYGVKVRNRIRDTEAKKNAKHSCPRCKYVNVKRVSAGIWKCRHCDYTFAGGAYVPKTERGASVLEVMREETRVMAAPEKAEE